MHETTTQPPRTTQRNGLLIGLAFAAFISLGLPDGLVGIGWPSIRQTFGLPLDALGALLVAFTCGYLVSSFLSGRLLARMGVGTLLALSCAATALALLVYGLAPAWWVIALFGLLSGLGAGAIDAGLNTYAAQHFDARTMNWLHASFGVGSTAGPLIMTAVLTGGQIWRLGFIIVSAMQFALAAGFALTRQRWEQDGTSEAPRDNQEATGMRGTLRLPVVWLSMVIFFIYTGLEVATGQWAFSLLTEARGVPTGLAGSLVSLYWASLTVGRVLFGVVASRVALDRALLVCMAGIALGAALVWLNLLPWLSFFGFALMGLCFAPVFPSLMSTTPARMPTQHVANAVGFQVAAASVGGASIPSLIGVAADATSLEVLGPGLLLGALALIAFFQALRSHAPAPSADPVASQS